MQEVEVHGAFWINDIDEEVVFKEYEENLDIFLIVVKKREDHFIAFIREKVKDPHWRLPAWCDVRPEGIFTIEGEAIEHTKALLKTRKMQA